MDFLLRQWPNIGRKLRKRSNLTQLSKQGINLIMDRTGDESAKNRLEIGKQFRMVNNDITSVEVVKQWTECPDPFNKPSPIKIDVKEDTLSSENIQSTLPSTHDVHSIQNDTTGKSSKIDLWNKKFEELLDLQRGAQETYTEDEEGVKNIVREMSIKMREQFDALSHKESVLKREQKKLTYLQNELINIIRQTALTDRKLTAVKNEQNNQYADLSMLLEKDVHRYENEISRREPILYAEYGRLIKMAKPEKGLQTFLRNVQHETGILKKLELLTYRRIALCQSGGTLPLNENANALGTPPAPGSVPSTIRTRKFDFKFPAAFQAGNAVMTGLSPEARYKKIVDGLVERAMPTDEQDGETENNRIGTVSYETML